ncbi:hypothetical protein AgCh_006264 [Apium graveolens]
MRQSVTQETLESPALSVVRLGTSPETARWLLKAVEEAVEEEFQFLGHIVGKDGIKVDPAKIEAVSRREQPKTPTEFRSFLGLVSYYRRFVKDFAKIATPLTKLTRKNERFVWTEKCEESFQELKKRLVTTPVLALPDEIGNFVIYIDASLKGLGCVLMQHDKVIANEERLLLLTFSFLSFLLYLPAKILRGITASQSSKPFSGALLQMADKRMTRLAKMNVARKSNDFPIRSRYTSLIDMINTRGDGYPSDAHLDAHDHNSALRDPKELEKLSSCFKIKEPFKLVLAGPADRACQWKKDALCVYRDTLRAGGDWGSLFRSSFGLAVDGSPNDITLSEEEARGFNLLTQDNGTSHSWDLIRETVLVERGLSPVNKKMAEKIEEATKPKDLETTRMKRAGKVFKDPRLGDRFPEFLLQAMEPSEEGPNQVLRTKQRPGAYFQPTWGIRGNDSIVGSTALSKEWSKHSISPVDYQDFILQQDLEGNELFGAQALATANAHFQGAIHQAKAWKVGLEDANKNWKRPTKK